MFNPVFNFLFRTENPMSRTGSEINKARSICKVFQKSLLKNELQDFVKAEFKGNEMDLF